MRVLFDHQIFSYQRFGGISRYFAELMQCYSKMEEVEYLLGVRESANESLKNTGLAVENALSIPKSPDNMWKLIHRYFKNDFYTRKLIKKNEFDVFHPTFFFPGLTRHLRGKPFVVTIVDMIPELFPEMYPLDSMYSKFVTHRWIEGKKELVKNASAIIAISEKTKNDLIEIYGLDADKIKVVYLGNSLCPPNKSEIPSRLKFPERYLLFVGTRNDYKNFDRFLRASAKIMKEDSELHVVCIGGGVFSKQENALISSLGFEGRLHQYNVTDDELYHAYENALAFVFPSLYEGFGIPIIEAFNVGCPVVLSDTSCFPEIASDAAVYFDPESERSIADALRQTIYDDLQRSKLKDKGLERGRAFTWEATARQTLDVYKTVLQQS